MTVFEAIKARRSVRKYKDIPISDDVINEMLEAARLAPTPGNSQNNVIGVVKDPSLKNQLAKAAGNQMWIASAPVVFALCSDISWDLKDQPEDDFGLVVNHLRFGKEFIQYTNQCPDRKTMNTRYANGGPNVPGEHIFLTAVAHGMSACFVGYLDTDRASEILNLPKYLSCLFLLPVGYADETPRQKKLKSINEISFFNKWGE
jgi:nitroreductase